MRVAFAHPWIFLFLLCPAQPKIAVSQIDSTLREYFPTHVGDLWEYEEYNPPMSFRYQISLTGDTLMPNGRRYYKFSGAEGGFYRIDDSMRVYKYTTTNPSCADSEYLIYNLAIRDGGIWSTCLRLFGGDSLSRFIGLYQTFPNFPLPRLQVARDVKQYCDAQVHMPSGDTTFCNLVPSIAYIPRRLARGFGLVWSQFEGPPHDLDGAIINGVRYGTVTSIRDQDINREAGPQRASLEQNYPNPFNPVTTIRFNVSEDAFVSLEIEDINGKAVKGIISKRMLAGTHEVRWDATDESGKVVATGTYFCRLTVKKAVAVRKFMFVK